MEQTNLSFQRRLFEQVGERNTHQNQLTTILNEHIQSARPPIRKFAEHPKEIEKIIRQCLTFINQQKITSYDQLRHDLKTQHKQTFYLVDPIVDITRDTFDHCDITRMNEKMNVEILDSNITQTSNLYNHMNSQSNLLTTEEYNLLKSNQLDWLNQYLIDNKLSKKMSNKKLKEFNKILNRTIELLILNVTSTWDELNRQLRREYPKEIDQCDHTIELIKQAQNDGFLFVSQYLTTKYRIQFLGDGNHQYI